MSSSTSRDHKEISMKLTHLLRHDKQFYDRYFQLNGTETEAECDLKLNGFAKLDDLIAFRSNRRPRGGSDTKLTKELIEKVVDCQQTRFHDERAGEERVIGKIRMEFNPERTHVRCLNGHSNGLRLDHSIVPAPSHAFHLTSEYAISKILGERQGLKLMGRDHIHMYKQLDPAILNPRDSKRNVILQINFPEDFVCKDPAVNNYIFSAVPIPCEFIERKCTLQEYINNGYRFL
ncbi:RNA 2'-phosphotransferase, tpt1 / kptA family domain-containing protein [Ditylenchus destructor]|uniref:RNA 2'-phosphotransferase, tpt1 / kptA family domain-containing protein n=1 Tax=Ditylenchus destructor TaxID=166010 RepID=A0AAD4MR54_9BILA|nr:RNA 2'-phosphotransferase, tpt1 / kptA family domain-containing protein [Ditylenchus destructor]